MASIWTNSDVHEFLDLYKTEPILWNLNHPLKRSRPEVTDAWIRIQKEFSLECSVTDLKKKKESLMAAYRINVRKKKNEVNYTPSWFAYDQMASFLGEIYEGDNSEMQHEGDSESLDATYIEENYTSDIILKSASATKSRKRKHNLNNSDSFIAPEFVQFTDTDENEKENKKKDDVSDIFCQLLAMKLRKLDEYDREVAMHEIDKIMFKAKIKQCRKLIKKEDTKRRTSASITQSEFDEEHNNLSDE